MHKLFASSLFKTEELQLLEWEKIFVNSKRFAMLFNFSRATSLVPLPSPKGIKECFSS